MKIKDRQNMSNVEDGVPKPKLLNGNEALAESARTGEPWKYGIYWFRYDEAEDLIEESTSSGYLWRSTDYSLSDILQQTNCRMVDGSEWSDAVKEEPKVDELPGALEEREKPEVVPLPKRLSRNVLRIFGARNDIGSPELTHLACRVLNKHLQKVMDEKIEAALKAKEEHE